jgi:hypothetical protein
MQYIEDHPEEHNQGMWFTKTACGTAACFAGTACILSGMKPDFSVREHNYGNISYYVQEDRARWVKPIATDLLGISEEDSEVLFHAHNTVEELKLYVKDLLNGEHL